MTRPRYHVADPLDQILCHMRGLDEWTHKAYRNLYVTSEGAPELAQLRELEAGGFVYQSQSPGFIPKESRCFRCTDLGKARAQSAHIRAKPKLTRGQKRYRDWLAEDSSRTFAEFLGIKPKRREREYLGSYLDESIFY